MAKKNRYQMVQISDLPTYDIVDVTTKIKTALSGYRETAYVLAHGCTKDNAEEIVIALNYYNNKKEE